MLNPLLFNLLRIMVCCLALLRSDRKSVELILFLFDDDKGIAPGDTELLSVR